MVWTPRDAATARLSDCLTEWADNFQSELRATIRCGRDVPFSVAGSEEET